MSKELPRTPEGWVEKAKDQESKWKIRRATVDAWTRINREDSDSWKAWKRYGDGSEALMTAILKGNFDFRLSVNRMIRQLRKEEYASGTIGKYRSVLPALFRYCGLDLDPDDLKEAFKDPDQIDRVKVTVETQFQQFQPSHVKSLLAVPVPWFRAMIATAVCTGHRATSVLMLRRRDFDWNRSPVWVTFVTMFDKMRLERRAFLSDYAKKIVLEYLEESKNPEWFIAGEDRKDPMSYSNAYQRLREALATIGLDDKSQKTGRFVFRGHGFRNTNLNITKACRYPWDWAEHIVGHVHPVQDSYPGDEVAADVWGRDVNGPMDKFLEGRKDWMPKWGTR